MIPRTTFFGDDNHAAVDAQITVLSDLLSEDEVLDRTQTEDMDDAEKEWTQRTGDCARDAALWLAGDEQNPPSKDWQSLAKKKR